MAVLSSEVALPGLWPFCPDCGDLSHPAATRCESCGAPLLVQQPYRERTAKLRAELAAWVDG